jgi:hypothetical protein
MSGLRAAVHVHSDWSYDARVPLDELAALFRQKHYDVVFMCEHDRGFTRDRFDDYVSACAAASSEGTLLVPGIEYADPADCVHVPVWGLSSFLGEGLPTIELLHAVNDLDGVSVFAHPVRRDAWEAFDPAWFELLTGIEFWTRKWDGWAPNRRAADVARRSQLVSIASLDLHRRNQLFPLAMELDVDGRPSIEGCVAAMRAGACRPTFAGLPAVPAARGALGAVIQMLERARRPVFGRARTALERVGTVR